MLDKSDLKNYLTKSKKYDEVQKFQAYSYCAHKLPIATKNGILIRIVEIDGSLRVLIEVNDDTIQDDLRDAIPLATRWRDALLEWQGPWSYGIATNFLEEICSQHNDGISYSQLAERINNSISGYLVEYEESNSKYQDWLESAKRNVRTWEDFADFEPLDAVNSALGGRSHARRLLIHLRFKEQEVEDILNSALARIGGGDPPFVRGYPVSREKLRSTLRNYRQGKKHKIVEELKR